MEHKRELKIILALAIFVLFLWSSSNLMFNLKSVDRDGDHLEDSEEFLIGTNPLDVDTDNDGMSDFDEYYYWTERYGGKIPSDFYE